MRGPAPPKALRDPRKVTVVTALDDIPARPPTVTLTEKDNPMSITTGRKAEVIKTYATKTGDTGSPEVQVAILSERTKSITETSKHQVKSKVYTASLFRL